MLKEAKDALGINSGGPRILMTIWLLISALLNFLQSRMEVVFSIKVGVSVVLCHLDSLTALYRIINIVATQ